MGGHEGLSLLGGDTEAASACVCVCAHVCVCVCVCVCAHVCVHVCPSRRYYFLDCSLCVWVCVCVAMEGRGVWSPFSSKLVFCLFCSTVVSAFFFFFFFFEGGVVVFDWFAGLFVFVSLMILPRLVLSVFRKSSPVFEIKILC